ncbi:MAG: bifunctional phosphoribosylaminoimidazolecarboxamide formyltransferase/IMP cyclohydrolase [Acidobacteria bacterium]|nr:bifunctional phosphoribosylaminoimidazolecarboxamide formyltransferase/IMP cyclohydrolase [Acidobacteriota bacterium]
MKIRTALISVYNKSGLEEFAKFLQSNNVNIISTGGTGKALKKAGVEYTEVSDLTGFPEVFDGRVKTLQPKIHGGILARRSNESDIREMEQNGIEPIDLVVVNLYPFEEVIKREGISLSDVIENIDIGGPAMIRAAAKNFNDVMIVISPDQYGEVMEHMQENDGGSTEQFRFDLAKAAFTRTAAYDRVISNYLDGIKEPVEKFERKSMEKFPAILELSGNKARDLRYGENPHQEASLYLETGYEGPSVASAEPIQGKKLSFNNILDFESAWRMAWEFTGPAAVIIKHNNPCGVATGTDLLEAYKTARSTDPVSAFGSVIGFNTELDGETAEEINTAFIEGVIAPSFTDEALASFAKKKNVRLLQLGAPKYSETDYDVKKIIGGILLQGIDNKLMVDEGLKVVTERKPTEEELTALEFGWIIAKYVKSNAIVYAKPGRTIGIGAGQMSRVDSARIGIQKAADAGLEIKGSIIASDAYFPFRDSIDAAAGAGVTAVIQPGGSIRDQEVIDAANEHKIAMVYTGMRHFRH